METSPARPFDEPSVGIVGVGLIGGSIAAALKARGHRGRVIGSGRNPERLEAARAAGLLDEITTDPPRASLVVFCTPVDLLADGIVEAAPAFEAGTLVTDAGSVKGTICRDVAGRLPEGVTFVGSHPLAGSEKNGFEHARADLFDGRVCVVTPEAGTPETELQRLEGFWSFLGAEVLRLSPQEHDRALAATSHVPHVVAAALSGTLEESLLRFAATGFADTTRIAAGDPSLWVPILQHNAEAVAAGLDRFGERLQAFRDALERGDAVRLSELLQEGKARRDALG